MPVLLFRLLRVECVDQWEEIIPGERWVADDLEFIAQTRHGDHGFYHGQTLNGQILGPSRLAAANDPLVDVEVDRGDRVLVQVSTGVMGGAAELGTIHITGEVPVTRQVMAGESRNQTGLLDRSGSYTYRIHYDVVRLNRAGAPASQASVARASADPALSDEGDDELVVACGNGRLAISHRYSQGAPVGGGRYWVTNAAGTAIYAEGTLDANGSVVVSDLPVPCADVRVLLEDSPNLYAVRRELQPPDVNYQFEPNRLLVRSTPALDWLVGCLIGDFNDDQDLGQIGVNLVVGLIPVADQVLDVRDLLAAIYNLLQDHPQEGGGPPQPGYLSGWQWANLFLCAVGAIPEFGTAVKGVVKIILRTGREGAAAVLRKVIELLHEFGYGDVLVLLRHLREVGVEAGRLGRLTLRGMLDWAKGFIRNLLRNARQMAADLGSMAGAAMRRMQHRLGEALSHLDSMFAHFQQEAIDAFNRMMDELVPPQYAMMPAGAPGHMGSVHMRVPETPAPRATRGSGRPLTSRVEAEVEVRQTGNTHQVRPPRGRGLRRTQREMRALRRMPAHLSRQLGQWATSAGISAANRRFYEGLFREFRSAEGEAVQWIEEGVVFINREGFIFGPYEVLKKLAENARVTAETRTWLEAIGSRFGFRESDRFIPAGERQFTRRAEVPDRAGPSAAELERRVEQRAPGSSPTSRRTELNPADEDYFQDRSLEAHHLLEDNVMKAFGMDTGNFAHGVAPCVLLNYETHQKYLTRLFAVGSAELDVAARRIIQAGRDWPTAHRLLTAALEHWNNRSDGFIRVTRMLLRRVAPAGSGGGAPPVP
ncbi:MAG: hypothetical protein U1G07_16045 [Verrucomicrobiota bacterium]